MSAALAVVEPTSSGLGGGGFYLLHRQADGFETMLDAREKAPGAATRDMYLDAAGNPIAHASIDGPLAAAIPGEPAAFDYLARKFGKLPLKHSLQPAIRLARDGFPLYARLQGAIRYKRELLLRSPDAAKVFLTADGAVPELGAIIKQPDLAATLEAMADKGVEGFYGGRVAQDLVNGVRAGGGIWTLEDLADYRVVERKPLVGEYHGARIVSASPPSSGGVALLDALNILSGFDLRSARLRHAQAPGDRGHAPRLPRPGDVPGRSGFRRRCRWRSSSARTMRPGSAPASAPTRRMPSDMLPGIESAPVGQDTTHFSVLDAAGNRVAATISINLFFGTGYMVPKTGVLLNNTMDDFSIKPGTPNRSAWWATPRTRSRRTSARSPA